MRTALLVTLLALLLRATSPAHAGEPDLARMRKQVERLEQAIEGLLTRIEHLEASLARLKGLPTPATAPGGPEAAPSGPIEETWDRFTGSRTLSIRSEALRAVHQDAPADRLEVHARWRVRKEESNPARYDLVLETSGRVRRWPAGSVAWLLIDGDRTRAEIEGKVEQRDGRYVESIAIRFDPEAATRFGAARSVEMRAGVWELTIPASFRAQAMRVNERLKEAPPR